MELLHLHSPDGRPLKTFDLAARPRRPLTLGAAPACDLPLPEGPDTLGALLRDEDGWLLAAADPAVPERRLVPGEPVALGPFLFRLECEAVEPRRQALRDALGGNRFRGLPVVADRLDALDRHWAALVAWHCAVRGFGGGAGGADEVDAYDSKGLLRADLYALEDATAALGDPALDRLLQEERQSLAKALAARIDGLCGKDGPGTPADIGSLRALARLGRAVATPDALAAARRADGFAATLSADYDRTCRDLLTRYRLERLAGNAAAAEAILGELLALGPADSPFWDWARRERARTAPNEEPQP